MKHILRLSIILAVSFAGEILSCLIPLPVPASIYGLILMFICLLLKVIPLGSVRGTGRFLTDIMPVMFIPAAVGLMDNWGAMKSMLLPCLLAAVPVTLIVVAISGHATQLILNRSHKEHKS